VNPLRRRRQVAAGHLGAAYRSFRSAVDALEEAKASLVSAAPTGRRAGGPLAEALAGFEEGLAAARRAMDGWRVPETEEAWLACSAGLLEVGRRADRLRLMEEAPEAYEQLYGMLGDLIEPLEAFDLAAARFRQLGE